MDIAAGTTCNCTQKITCYNDVRRCTSNSSWRFWGNSTRTIGTQPTTDSLKSKSTFCTLSLYSMMRSFHWQVSDKSLQWFICTCTCVTSKTSIHSFFPPVTQLFYPDSISVFVLIIFLVKCIIINRTKIVKLFL